MQTFLPYSDFRKTAQVLDYKRLGKQRVEAMQLLKGDWPHHPASKMWRGYEFTLTNYAIIICDEWILRGYKDTCKVKILRIFRDKYYGRCKTSSPKWLGDPKFHLSHQSNLVRKNPEYYQKFFPDVKGGLPYIWPVK